MKFLIVVPPFTGHMNPTRGVGEALLEAGHEVAWCGHAAVVRDLPAGAQSFVLSDGPAAISEDVRARGAQLRGLRSVKYFYEAVLVPLARGMAAGVTEAALAFGPDRMWVDQQAVAGAMVARQLQIPWMGSCSTSAALAEPLADFPQILAWRSDLLRALQAEFRLEPVDRPGLSPTGNLCFSTAELVGAAVPPHTHFVGPILRGRRPTDFDFDALDPDRKRVLVSLGTVSGSRGARFFGAVAEAFAELDAQAVVVAPADQMPSVPDNVIRADFVPQLELLPRMDAVVSHAGHNTVVESLAAGKPMVLAPIRDDQPVVASQVVRAGAGVRVKFGRVDGARLRKAISSVLTEPGFVAGAERIQRSFASAGGAVRAASLLAARSWPEVPLETEQGQEGESFRVDG